MSTRAMRAMGDVLTDADKKVSAIVGMSAPRLSLEDERQRDARAAANYKFQIAMDAALDMWEQDDFNLGVTALEGALQEMKLRAREARADAAGVVSGHR